MNYVWFCIAATIFCILTGIRFAMIGDAWSAFLMGAAAGIWISNTVTEYRAHKERNGKD